MKRAVSSTVSSLCDFYQVTLASAAVAAGSDITALATKQSIECRDGSSQTDPRPMGFRSPTTQTNARTGDVEPTASNSNNNNDNDNNNDNNSKNDNNSSKNDDNNNRKNDNNAADGAYMTKVDNAGERVANAASLQRWELPRRVAFVR